VTRSGAGCERVRSYAALVHADRNWRWGLAAAIALLAWVAGYFFWDSDESVEEFGTYFDRETIRAILVFGLALAVPAGLLLGRNGGLRLVGFWLFVMATVGVSMLASVVFFGGICLDPGEDECITDWPSRVGALGAALAVMTAGYLAEFAAGRFARAVRDGG